MKIRDLSRHAREAAAKPPRGGPEAQTNRPEVNVRSFHESSFRQKGTLCPVDQLPLKALIKVLIRFYRLSLSLSLSLFLLTDGGGSSVAPGPQRKPRNSRAFVCRSLSLPPFAGKNTGNERLLFATFEADLLPGWVLEVA